MLLYLTEFVIIRQWSLNINTMYLSVDDCNWRAAVCSFYFLLLRFALWVKSYLAPTHWLVWSGWTCQHSMQTTPQCQWNGEIKYIIENIFFFPNLNVWQLLHASNNLPAITSNERSHKTYNKSQRFGNCIIKLTRLFISWFHLSNCIAFIFKWGNIKKMKNLIQDQREEKDF